MIRVEYEYLCDKCDRQEIICGDVGEPIKATIPWNWTHSRYGDFCDNCNGRAAKEKSRCAIAWSAEAEA